jgi:uncharacterized protein (DUF302 family)
VFIRPIVFIAALVVAVPGPALAQDGRVTAVSRAPFARVAAAIEQAVTDQKMALVCHANAQKGAAARGVAIRGNHVFMVFRNDFAVRLLAADPAAGFEPPLRIYAYENADGTATVTYAPPSLVFGRYAHPEVQAIGRELDPIFKAIVDTALAAR